MACKGGCRKRPLSSLFLAVLRDASFLALLPRHRLLLRRLLITPSVILFKTPLFNLRPFYFFFSSCSYRFDPSFADVDRRQPY